MNENEYSNLHKLNFENLMFDVRSSSLKHEDLSGQINTICEFLISELNRSNNLKKSGESHNVGRGRVPADSLLKNWAVMLLEQCEYAKISPPENLVSLFYRLLKCNYYEQIKRDETFYDVLSVHRKNPELSLREIEKNVGVDHSTVKRAIDKGPTSLKESDFVWYNTVYPDAPLNELAKKYEITETEAKKMLKAPEMQEFIKIINASNVKDFLTS